MSTAVQATQATTAQTTAQTTALAVHIYIDGAAVNACEFNKTKTREFQSVLLNALKPANKNHYLELDMDSNDEHSVITCTNEHDAAIPIPADILARTNKYVAIPSCAGYAWNHGNLKVWLSMM